MHTNITIYLNTYMLTNLTIYIQTEYLHSYMTAYLRTACQHTNILRWQHPHIPTQQKPNTPASEED